jgi:hypothetical protein
MTCYRDLVYIDGPELEPSPFTLTHDVTVIELPDPIIGNQEELNVERVQRKTLNGELIVYSDPLWVNETVLRYKFQTVETSLRDAFFAFLEDTLGLEVTLTDHLGRQYIGTVTNVTEGSEQAYRHCGHTIGFDLEVVNVNP